MGALGGGVAVVRPLGALRSHHVTNITIAIIAYRFVGLLLVVGEGGPVPGAGILARLTVERVGGAVLPCVRQRHHILGANYLIV